jgi:hypothetical protein
MTALEYPTASGRQANRQPHRRGRRAGRDRERRWRLGALLTAVAVGAPSAWAVTRIIDTGVIGDFAAHIRYAHQFAGTLKPPIGQFLFTVLDSALGELAGNYELAAVVIVTAAQVVLALVVYAWLTRRTPDSFGGFTLTIDPMLGVGLSVAILFAGPASILLANGLGGNYLGYVAVTAYHSPTQLLLRPLAVLLFLAVSAVLVGRSLQVPRRVAMLGFATLTIATTLAKPSYTICIVPAAIVVLVVQRARRPSIDVGLLWWGFFVPAGAATLLAYLLTYVTGIHDVESGGVVLAPFDTYSHYSHELLLKFLLSAAFPIAVAWAYRVTARRDLGLKLAWVAFAFGTAATYLLAESGVRRYDGNFWWSGQITLFILYLSSLAHVLSVELQRRRDEGRWVPGGAAAACALVFTFNVVSGITFLLANGLEPRRILG